MPDTIIATGDNINGQSIVLVEPASTPRSVHFKELSALTFAGLNYSPENMLIVHFPEGHPIADITGDQGVGKTSLQKLLLTLMGKTEPDNAINSTTGTKSASLLYEKEGKQFRSRIMKGGRKLELVIPNEDGTESKSTMDSPAETLAKHFGNIATSPDFLAQSKFSGEAQIEWVKSLVAGASKEIEGKEKEIKGIYNTAYEKRKEANSTHKRLKTEILSTGMYSWDEDQKHMVSTANLTNAVTSTRNTGDAESIKKAFEEAQAEAGKLATWENGLKGYQEKQGQLESDIQAINAQIEALLLAKSTKESALQETKNSIEKGLVHVAENKERIEKNYSVANENLQNSAKIAVLKRDIDQANQKVAELNTTEQLQSELNALIDDALQQMKDLAAQYTPKIEGLEIEAGGNIDAKRPVGVYYNGTNISYLSESERWDLCLQLWKITNTRIVFIENSSSLGSAAVERINWFVKNGGRVFMSTMMRQQKELKVTFHDKI